jgi:hypothetical protein
MAKIESRGIASIEFILRWNSSHADHTDCYYAKRVTFWRDIFSRKFYDSFIGKVEGERFLLSGAVNEIVTSYHADNEFNFELRHFDTRYGLPVSMGPRFGRFYPKGILRGLPNVFRGNIEPFRCVGVDATQMRVDFNHPLSQKPVQLFAGIDSVGKKSGDVGGSCTDWMEVISNGPGMQARSKGKATDFFSDSPFKRADENDDSVFYSAPRLLTHTDDEALGIIRGIYGSLLKDGMRVLDLMSSWRSHIPENIVLQSLIGLGLNREEMEDNKQLSDFVIHDLNRDYRLPFQDQTFDLVICTVSVEYLTQPFRVFEEVARVLIPGGIFVAAFSNRWFPPKTIHIWTELHEFERVGLVLEYFLRSGKFGNISTYSMRGRPRPLHDKHFVETQIADPVYAVWGRTSSESIRE